ncbi:hypothetical protein ACS0TY_025763 [Phlomoides rotata]
MGSGIILIGCRAGLMIVPKIRSCLVDRFVRSYKKKTSLLLSGSATQGEISFLSWNSKVQHILASTSSNGTTGSRILLEGCALFCSGYPILLLRLLLLQMKSVPLLSSCGICRI